MGDKREEMDRVLYTQRVEIIESYKERRDCGDQMIPKFLQACGYLPIPTPNLPDVAERIVRDLGPVGIVFTGGNSLVKYGGQAPERDETEKKLLDIAIERKIPIYGFCRGMEVILDYFGCPLEEVKGHVALYHRIQGKLGQREVNSFHNQGCFEVTEPLEVLAFTEDGVIESVACKEKNIFATMWHPEREKEFSMEDIKRIQILFKKGGYR